jgi:hypothetical protein
MVNLEDFGNLPKYSPFLPYLLVLVALRVRLLLSEEDKNSNALDYSVPFVENLRRTLD